MFLGLFCLTFAGAVSAETNSTLKNPDSSSARASTSLNYQGISGGLNIPSAYVLDVGKVQFLYSNQLELGSSYVDGHNYHIGFGLLPNLELTGRIATETNHDNLFQNPGIRDLSANIKWKIPRNSYRNLVVLSNFDFALGIQDLGGESSYFKAVYGVASYARDKLTYHVGFGKSDSLADRMDGAFAGLEYRPKPYLRFHLETEDRDSFAYGLTLTNSFPILPIDWHLSVSEFTHKSVDNPFFSFGFSMPLSGTRGELRRSGINRVLDQHVLQEHGPEKAETNKRLTDSSIPSVTKSKLIKLLKDQGFEDVEVSEFPNRLSVSFENNVFNSNEIDAIGVALGLSSTLAQSNFKKTHLTLNNFGIPVLKLEIDNQEYQHYLTGEKSTASIKSLEVANGNITSFFKQSLFSEQSFVPRIMFHPAINSAIATEYGVLDYSLALRTNVQLPLWRGNVIETAYDIPLANSQDYKRGYVFGEQRHKAGIRNLLWHQALPLGSGILSQLSAGKIRRDYHGGIGAIYWQPGPGWHRFSIRAGEFRADQSDQSKRFSVARYRYYWSKHDMSVELSAGKYWLQDKGFKIESHHYFGDTTVSLIFIDTDYQLAGIAISLPLTARKDMKPGYVQLKGSEHWRYSVLTRVNNSVNTLNEGLADEPMPAHNLQRSYYNNDRLGESYIGMHRKRMKEAFINYVPMLKE